MTLKIRVATMMFFLKGLQARMSLLEQEIVIHAILRYRRHCSEGVGGVCGGAYSPSGCKLGCDVYICAIGLVSVASQRLGYKGSLADALHVCVQYATPGDASSYTSEAAS
jgi:hypothetical protein